MLDKVYFLLYFSYLYAFPFYIIIGVILMLYLLIFYKNFYNNIKEKAINNDDFYILKLLDYIYVYNIYLEILKASFLFFATSGLIICLRHYNFNKDYNIWELFNPANPLSFHYIFYIIIFVVSFLIYIKTLSVILKDSFYKIHLYCFQYSWYHEFSLWIWEYHGNQSSTLGSKASSFLGLILNRNSYFDKHFLNKNTVHSKILTYLVKKTQENHRYFIIIKNIHSFIHIINLHRFLKGFYHYFPWIILYITFVYDLNNNHIKYLYYGLFITFIIQLYREYRKFIGETDFHELDDRLVTYFYKENIHKELIAAENSKRESILRTSGIAYYEIYDTYITAIKEYIKKQYRVDYIDITLKNTYYPFNIRFLVIGLLYLYFNFCFNISYIYFILFAIPLVISYISYEVMHYKKHKYLYIFKIMFFNIFILSCILFTYLYLVKYNFFFIKDTITIFSFEIKQSFSLEFKYEFLYNYLNYVLENNNHLTMEDKKYILEILTKTNIQEYITNDVTIHQIKLYVENLIPYYIKLQEIIEKTHYHLKYYYENVYPNTMQYHGDGFDYYCNILNDYLFNKHPIITTIGFSILCVYFSIINYKHLDNALQMENKSIIIKLINYFFK